MTEDVRYDAPPPVEDYAQGSFLFAGGGRVNGSVLLLPRRLAPWPVQSLKSANVSDFDPIFQIADELDFVLIGSGAEIGPLPKHIRDEFAARGLAVDTMQTGAACRTYNVVLGEGRRMAAALIAVGHS